MSTFKTNFASAVIGKSAYEIWLDQGNEGTVQDFLDSLKESGLTDRVAANETEIEAIKNDIDMAEIGTFNNVKSACSAFYSNIGNINSRLIALENSADNNSNSGADSIAEMSGDSSLWLRKWQSGFIEMGGAIMYYGQTEFINFPASFETTNYYINFSLIGNPDATPENVPFYVSDKYTTGACFNSNYYADSNQLTWYACGY